MRADMEAFCAKIGADPLLVQGAGGNASWKEGDTLWVKASGTWLADAARQDIFAPVEIAPLRAAMGKGDFAAQPVALSTALRPSIETLLHALMPQKVVLHLHAVEVLAHLVRGNFPAGLQQSLAGEDLRWVAIPYRKPGADLARAVSEGLTAVPGATAVMMKNHGLVIGGESVAEVERILQKLTTTLSTPARRPLPAHISPLPEGLARDYQPVGDGVLHQLALDEVLFGRLARDWALYPDHVVFLGPKPLQYESLADWAGADAQGDIVFVRGAGVYGRPGLSEAKLVQLRCYHDVLTRQAPGDRLATLTPAEIADLLNWDAEKYRIGLSR